MKLKDSALTQRKQEEEQRKKKEEEEREAKRLKEEELKGDIKKQISLIICSFNRTLFT